MSVRIQARADYSALFTSLSKRQSPSASFFGSTGNMSDLTKNVLGGSTSVGGVNLSDYASIKNGSYKKLLKSYFNMKEEEAKKAESSDKTDKEEINFAKIGADKTDKVFTTAWEDIVTEANSRTDALYTELGLKQDTVKAGSYLDTTV